MGNQKGCAMATGIENCLNVEPQQSVWWRETADEARNVRNLAAITGTLMLAPTVVAATKWDSTGLLEILFGTITTLSYFSAIRRAYGLATNKYQSTQS